MPDPDAPAAPPGTILLIGTGAFASRIACDIAATARHPIRLVLAGRNALRLAWLVSACNARAATFGTGLRAEAMEIDLSSPEAAAPTLAAARPGVVVQAASVQTASVIAGSRTAWAQLVTEGGLSATAVFQALLSSRVGAAMRQAAPTARLVNCCFPDVVNGMLVRLGLPIVCGVGNVAILSACFSGVVGPRTPLKVLAHYQTIGAWRRPPGARAGFRAPRVWLDGIEVRDVHDRFAAVQLTPEPVIEVSGSADVPLLVAMATPGSSLSAHAPGALGLPGGYPVRWQDGALALDLPADLSRDAAIAWNERFEAENGLLVGTDGRVTYTGKLHERLRTLSPDLAGGFALSDLEAVHVAMAELRARLQRGGG